MPSKKDSPWEEIARFGRKVVSSGLASSRFGNISIRSGDMMIITRTGSMLDEIDEGEVVEVDAWSPCPLDAVASTETCVHRAIYAATDVQAIIHTHSPYAVALSLLEADAIEPLDGEGLHFLGSMPIVAGGFGSMELAAAASDALRGHKACVARGHGVFATGGDLTGAYTAASMAEHSSQVRYLVQAYRWSLGVGRPPCEENMG